MTNESYAALIRDGMRRRSQPGRPIRIRQLAQQTGYSYEHVRKILKGEQVGSAELNAAICRVLKLDSERMWEVAIREKLRRKYGRVGVIQSPPDPRFRALWAHLSESEKETILRLAEGFVLSKRLGS